MHVPEKKDVVSISVKVRTWGRKGPSTADSAFTSHESSLRVGELKSLGYNLYYSTSNQRVHTTDAATRSLGGAPPEAPGDYPAHQVRLPVLARRKRQWIDGNGRSPARGQPPR